MYLCIYMFLFTAGILPVKKVMSHIHIKDMFAQILQNP